MPLTGEVSECDFEFLMNEITSQYSDICDFVRSSQISLGPYSHSYGIFCWRSQLDPGVRPCDELLRWYACMCVHVLNDECSQMIREEFPEIASHERTVAIGDADQFFSIPTHSGFQYPRIADEYPRIPAFAESAARQLCTVHTSRWSRQQLAQGMNMAVESGMMFHLYRRYPPVSQPSQV